MNNHGKLFCLLALIAAICFWFERWGFGSFFCWSAVVTYVLALNSFNAKLDEKEDQSALARLKSVPTTINGNLA